TTDKAWSACRVNLTGHCATNESTDNAVLFACLGPGSALPAAALHQHPVLVQPAAALFAAQGAAAHPGLAAFSYPGNDPHCRELDGMQQWLDAPGRPYRVGRPGSRTAGP